MKFPLREYLFAASLFLFTFCSQPQNPETPAEGMKPPLLDKPASYLQDSTSAFDQFHRAEIYAYMYKVDSALMLAQDCVQRFDHLLQYTADTLTWIYYIDSYFNVGYLYQLKQENDSAFKYLNLSLDWCRKKLGEDHLIATKCLIKLGNCYRNYGELVKSKEYFLKAYEIRVRTMDSLNNFLVNVYNNMASFYWEMGDVDHAEIFASRMQSLVKTLYDNFVIRHSDIPDAKFYKQFMGTNSRPPVVRNLLLSNIPRQYIGATINKVWIHLNNDEPEIATYLADLADSLIKKHEPGNDFLQRSALDSRAAIHLYHGEWKKAEELMTQFRKSESGAALVNRHFLRYRLADFFLKTGKYQDCINLVDASLRDPVVSSSNPEFVLLELKARALLKGGQPGDCIRFCKEILDQIHQVPSMDSLVAGLVQWERFTGQEVLRVQDFLKPLIQSMVSIGIQENSINVLEQGYRLLQTFHASMKRLQDELYRRQSKTNRLHYLYPFYEDALELCAHLYEQTGNESYAREAFYISDLVKAFQIKELLDKQNISAYGQEAAPRSQAEQLKTEIAYLRDQILEMERTSPVKDTLKLFNLKKTQAELAGQLVMLAEKEPMETVHVPNPYSLDRFPFDRLRDYLKQEQADLLDYFTGTKHLYLLHMNQSQFRIIKQEANSGLEALAIKFSDALNPETDQTARDSLGVWSAGLYDLLIKPVEDQISGNHLIVIPDGFLARLPFECLQSSIRGFEDSPLGKRTIRYEYASGLLLKEPPLLKPDENYAGFAPRYEGHEIFLQRGLDSLITYPLYAANREAYGNLLFNEPEVLESANIWKGEAYTGLEVDKSKLLRNGANARILHLAMHAIADDKHPEYSQLILKNPEGPGRNEAIYAYEIARMHLNAELSVLSACNSGKGKYLKGEGVMSLARAFKAAGCPNVVMSLWQANDASTKDLIVSFFKHLKTGLGKADALRKAKEDYLANAIPELKHPYYWAGLVLVGDNEPLILEGMDSISYWILAALLAGTVLLAFWLRRQT